MKKSYLLVALGSLLVLASCEPGTSSTGGVGTSIGPVEGETIDAAAAATALGTALEEIDLSGVKATVNLDGKANMQQEMVALSSSNGETTFTLYGDITTNNSFKNLTVNAELGGLAAECTTADLYGSATLTGGYQATLDSVYRDGDGKVYTEEELKALNISLPPVDEINLPSLNEEVHIYGDKLYFDLSKGLSDFINNVIAATSGTTTSQAPALDLTKFMSPVFGELPIDLTTVSTTIAQISSELNTYLPMVSMIGTASYTKGADDIYSIHVDVSEAQVKNLMVELIVTSSSTGQETEEELAAMKQMISSIIAPISLGAWKIDLNYKNDGSYFALALTDIVVDGGINIPESMSMDFDIDLDLNVVIETGVTVDDSWEPTGDYLDLSGSTVPEA